MHTLFPSLQASARVWIWVADRKLTASEQAAVDSAVNGFLAGWTSHQRQVRGATSILRDQVLVLAAEIPDGEISGCGIDKSVHLLERVAAAQGFLWTSALDVPVLDGPNEEIVVVSRASLRSGIRYGGVSPDTLIIDRTIVTLGELRSAGVVRRAEDTWAGRYFPADTRAIN